jgi:hypothetical protein
MALRAPEMSANKMRVMTALTIALLTIASSARLDAWGGLGHRLVALLAAERLTPMARRNVTWLLGPETMADVSSWADRQNDGVYQTFYWHFINIPPDATSYDRDRDCLLQPTVEKGSRADIWRDCVIDRILYHKARLADSTMDRSDRAIALKYLVHLVGDIHQPFHTLGVGHGGNDIKVSVFGSDTCGSYPCNLHSVWDGGLIAHTGLDEAHYLPLLRELIAKDRIDTAAVGGPVDWAMQSHRLAKAALVPDQGTIDEAYYRAHIPEINQRMAQAGVRLAAVLNEILVTAPPEW